MAYQVLARKWRPQTFASLIGQQAVVTALSNALRDGRIAQAYLFSGIRGVGKTTAARVFAKALNCERGTANGPCNECPTCDEITKGADMDVLEIDAATYSKVEQVRELAESLKYGPARDRYKVVVLDEVHRLSRQAFDALLKIVEEPPPRLVFIFATTEIEAVPATILSRCQEFHFRRVSNRRGGRPPAPHLPARRRSQASDAALALLARAGEGSVRDSVALLDQLATFGNGVVDEQEAIRLLGGIDLALFQKVLVAILAGDAPAVSRLALEVEENGWDPRTVHAHFLSFCRDALHLALGAGGAGSDSGETLALPAEERKALAEIAKRRRIREPPPPPAPPARQRERHPPQRSRLAGARDRLAASRRAAAAGGDREASRRRRAGAPRRRHRSPGQRAAAASSGRSGRSDRSGRSAALPAADDDVFRRRPRHSSATGATGGHRVSRTARAAPADSRRAARESRLAGLGRGREHPRGAPQRRARRGLPGARQQSRSDGDRRRGRFRPRRHLPLRARRSRRTLPLGVTRSLSRRGVLAPKRASIRGCRRCSRSSAAKSPTSKRRQLQVKARLPKTPTTAALSPTEDPDR